MLAKIMVTMIQDQHNKLKLTSTGATKLDFAVAENWDNTNINFNTPEGQFTKELVNILVIIVSKLVASADIHVITIHPSPTVVVVLIIVRDT